MPAFMILSDAVLRAIASASPQILTSLRAIPGMGPIKVERYGADLIAICRGDAAPSTAAPSTAAPSTDVKDGERVRVLN